jgi:flavin reductase (DIM6/NTAB) family NADH-FMN oxidoreductase RutF
VDENTPDRIQELMRDGLRRLAKAVVVITCSFDGKRYAMAATAVSELSMEPPSLLVCVNRSASISPPLAHRVDFAVNILHSSHQTISALCSGALKGEERFKLGNWETSQSGLPILSDAQAIFECNHSQMHSFGTHDIIIGEVFACTVSGAADPLIYLDQRYSRATSD